MYEWVAGKSTTWYGAKFREHTLSVIEWGAKREKCPFADCGASSTS